MLNVLLIVEKQLTVPGKLLGSLSIHGGLRHGEPVAPTAAVTSGPGEALLQGPSQV